MQYALRFSKLKGRGVYGCGTDLQGGGNRIAGKRQILSKTGRDEQSMLVSVAGVVIIMLMLVSEIADLLQTIRSLFGL